jgi:hypothetical protein
MLAREKGFQCYCIKHQRRYEQVTCRKLEVINKVVTA